MYSPACIIRCGSLMLIDEMSYNPMRFGTQNPFTTNDMAAIRFFCNLHRKPDKDIMSKIASELWFFLRFIEKSNPEFMKDEKINSESILIRCNGNKKANDGYKALACLVHAIHLIASQNLQDYRIKKYRNGEYGEGDFGVTVLELK